MLQHPGQRLARAVGTRSDERTDGAGGPRSERRTRAPPLADPVAVDHIEQVPGSGLTDQPVHDHHHRGRVTATVGPQVQHHGLGPGHQREGPREQRCSRRRGRQTGQPDGRGAVRIPDHGRDVGSSATDRSDVDLGPARAAILRNQIGGERQLEMSEDLLADGLDLSQPVAVDLGQVVREGRQGGSEPLGASVDAVVPGDGAGQQGRHRADTRGSGSRRHAHDARGRSVIAGSSSALGRA